MLSANQIRNIWIKFWISKKHTILPSASLVPKDDPSLLWINSGVATLKQYFAGEKVPKNPRIANSQKSIRTNDIDNVGLTARHHTLFEMLGNFSIGGYFKDKALEWAFEFLFDVLKFQKNKIYITYYEKDDYTYQKWQKLGILQDHLIKGNKTTNFWDVGAGPCGPDTEIFYDRGDKYDPHGIGLKLLKEDIENDRYVEIWNIVFSQFNNDGENNYTELKNKNIDTGAGLERIASILQDVPTNFDTDLFLPIIQEIEKLSTSRYKMKNYFEKEPQQIKINKHFRIIADHIRAISQGINDGVKPSSTQRGYVIRKLIRRAYYSGLQLGIKTATFLHKLVKVANDALAIYPIKINLVAKIIKLEEEAFSKIIKQGKMLVNKLLANNQVNEALAFKLFDTHGLPLELIENLLEKKGIRLNQKIINDLKQKHALESQSKQFIGIKKSKLKVMDQTKSQISTFIGYDKLSSDSLIIQHIVENNRHYLLLDQTPFYATSGGQLHDLGTINQFPVADVFKDKHGNHWHVLDSWDRSQKEAIAIVNSQIRLAKARNHSGTHILGHALRMIISPKIIQLGSENNEHKLRFDFPMTRKLTTKEVSHVELAANKIINEAIPRDYIIDTFKNGLAMGALAIDNEIEGDPNQICRIVKFGDSIEFCGGTHVPNTNVLEKLKIIKLETKGAGIYRIEALTSNKAIKTFETNQKAEIINSIEMIIAKNKLLNKNYKCQTPKQLSSIKNLNDLLVKIKNDNKQLRKKTKDLVIDFEIKFQKFKTMNAFIKLDVIPQDVKATALKLSANYPQKLIIIGAKFKKYLIAIASKKYDCQKLFASFIEEFNGSGGGNKNFAMGTLEDFQIT